MTSEIKISIDSLSELLGNELEKELSRFGDRLDSIMSTFNKTMASNLSVTFGTDGLSSELNSLEGSLTNLSGTISGLGTDIMSLESVMTDYIGGISGAKEETEGFEFTVKNVYGKVMEVTGVINSINDIKDAFKTVKELADFQEIALQIGVFAEQMGLASGAATSLSVALGYVLPVLAVAAGAFLIYKIIDENTRATNEYNEALEGVRQKQETFNETLRMFNNTGSIEYLEDLKKQYKNLAIEIDETSKRSELFSINEELRAKRKEFDEYEDEYIPDSGTVMKKGRLQIEIGDLEARKKLINNELITLDNMKEAIQRAENKSATDWFNSEERKISERVKTAEFEYKMSIGTDEEKSAIDNLVVALKEYEEFNNKQYSKIYSKIYDDINYESLIKTRKFEITKQEQDEIIQADKYKKNSDDTAIRIKDLENRKKALNKTTEVSVETLGDENEKLENQNKELEQQQKEREELNRQIEEQIILQKELQKQHEQDIKYIDELFELTKNMVKQGLQDEIDTLNEKKDIYKEIIELKKQEIDKAEEQKDYEKERTEKEKEIAKLQSELMEISRDDSLEAQAEKLQLEEEIAEKQEELSEYINDRNVELRKEALDEELSAYEQTQDNEIEKLEEKLNDANYIVTEANRLLKEDIENNSTILYEKLLEWNNKYGTGIEQDITTAWDHAYEAMMKYKNAVPGGDISFDSARKYYDIESIKSQMYQNSLSWHTADESTKNELASANRALAKIIGATYNKAGYWVLDGKRLYEISDIPKYDNGGKSISTHGAIVHGTSNSPEWIFNDSQLKSVIASSVIAYDLLPKISIPSNYIQPNKSNIGGNVLSIENLIKIEGNVDKTIIPKIETIADKVVMKINKQFSSNGQLRPIQQF